MLYFYQTSFCVFSCGRKCKSSYSAMSDCGKFFYFLTVVTDRPILRPFWWYLEWVAQAYHNEEYLKDELSTQFWKVLASRRTKWQAKTELPRISEQLPVLGRLRRSFQPSSDLCPPSWWGSPPWFTQQLAPCQRPLMFPVWWQKDWNQIVLGEFVPGITRQINWKTQLPVLSRVHC